jgi:TPR repeat protein
MCSVYSKVPEWHEVVAQPTTPIPPEELRSWRAQGRCRPGFGSTASGPPKKSRARLQQPYALAALRSSATAIPAFELNAGHNQLKNRGIAMKPSEQISSQIAHLNSAEDHSRESIADHAADLFNLIPAIASFQFTEEERETIFIVFDAVLDDQTSYFQTGWMWKDYSAEDLKDKIAYLRNAGSIVRRLGAIQVADGFDALATEIEKPEHEGDRSPSRPG